MVSRKVLDSVGISPPEPGEIWWRQMLRRSAIDSYRQQQRWKRDALGVTTDVAAGDQRPDVSATQAFDTVEWHLLLDRPSARQSRDLRGGPTLLAGGHSTTSSGQLCTQSNYGTSGAPAGYSQTPSCLLVITSRALAIGEMYGFVRRLAGCQGPKKVFWLKIDPKNDLISGRVNSLVHDRAARRCRNSGVIEDGQRSHMGR